VGRAARELFGGRVDRTILLPASYRRSTVTQLISRISAAIDHPARDASVSVDGSAKLVTVPSRRGAKVDVSELRGELVRALGEPTSSHVLTIPVGVSRPKVTTRMLVARYPAYIVVDRPAFKLLLYQRLHLTHSYGIAVGRAGLQTPAGLHQILDKQVNPAWHVPNSSWAGSLAGRVIPPGPQDPLVARWMAIDDQGDGIHGTNEPWSIGSAASHGCIRMLVPDVIELYSMTPLGTPVYVI
jgi:lipoprotein-anchoring transpeptidase ErfK/SrfK